MKQSKRKFGSSVTLVGGGEINIDVLDDCLDVAPHLIAADGGANWLDQQGYEPEMVIGDFDSLHNPTAWRNRLGQRACFIADQNLSDLDKCLQTIDAPAIFAVGFTGGRLDHMLYALQTIAFADQSIFLIDNSSIAANLRVGTNQFATQPGEVVSILPTADFQVTKASGLKWQLDGRTLSPKGLRSLSNEARSESVSLVVEDPGGLFILSRQGRSLSALLKSQHS